MKFKRNKQSAVEEPRPSGRVNYIDGLAVETELGYYLVRRGVRVPFPSKRVFDTWGLHAIRSSEAACQHLPVVGIMGIREGSLVVDFMDNKLYMISGGKRRLVSNPSFLEDLQIDPIEAIVVSHEEILLHSEAEVII